MNALHYKGAIFKVPVARLKVAVCYLSMRLAARVRVSVAVLGLAVNRSLITPSRTRYAKLFDYGGGRSNIGRYSMTVLNALLARDAVLVFS